MRVKIASSVVNATEHLVLAELRERRTSVPGDSVLFCCEACDQDVAALALSSLPPHYCTRFDCVGELTREGSVWVRESVTRSLERVKRHPKHDRIPDDGPEMGFRLVNFSFQVGEAVLDKVVGREESACACPQCRSDVLAYALNRYPPKYGVERKGEIDFPPKERALVRRELAGIVAAAAEVVSKRPRHD